MRAINLQPCQSVTVHVGKLNCRTGAQEPYEMERQMNCRKPRRAQRQAKISMKNRSAGRWDLPADHWREGLGQVIGRVRPRDAHGP